MLCFTSKYVTWVIYKDLYNTCFHYAVHLAAHVHDINRQEMQDQQSVVCWHDDFVKMCWHLEKSCECVVNSSAAKKDIRQATSAENAPQKNNLSQQRSTCSCTHTQPTPHLITFSRFGTASLCVETEMFILSELFLKIQVYTI